MRRQVAWLAALVVLSSGCSNPGEEPTDPPAPGSSAPSPFSEATTEAFVDPHPSPPALTLMPIGDDFENVIREIFAFRTWLFAHPDRTDLISEIFHPDCSCTENLREDLQELVAKGQRVVAGDEFTEIEVRDVQEDSRTLVITRRSVNLRLIDRDGEIVNELDAAEPIRSLIAIIKQPDGKWRVTNITTLVGSQT